MPCHSVASFHLGRYVVLLNTCCCACLEGSMYMACIQAQLFMYGHMDNTPSFTHKACCLHEGIGVSTSFPDLSSSLANKGIFGWAFLHNNCVYYMHAILATPSVYIHTHRTSPSSNRCVYSYLSNTCKV